MDKKTKEWIRKYVNLHIDENSKNLTSLHSDLHNAKIAQNSNNWQEQQNKIDKISQNLLIEVGIGTALKQLQFTAI